MKLRSSLLKLKRLGSNKDWQRLEGFYRRDPHSEAMIHGGGRAFCGTETTHQGGRLCFTGFKSCSTSFLYSQRVPLICWNLFCHTCGCSKQNSSVLFPEATTSSWWWWSKVLKVSLVVTFVPVVVGNQKTSKCDSYSPKRTFLANTICISAHKRVLWLKRWRGSIYYWRKQTSVTLKGQSGGGHGYIYTCTFILKETHLKCLKWSDVHIHVSVYGFYQCCINDCVASVQFSASSCLLLTGIEKISELWLMDNLHKCCVTSACQNSLKSRCFVTQKD